ncbi:cysteine desulfurase family protein [Wolbachia endosymbiont of Drosophila aff. chauvacae BK-2020]|uniref:cysteine desulfurase family protein n=1 Tax=unclassified Wolbachia TaxID=2640676 RepID=UPI0023A97E40|nr:MULTISPECIES: cysteine desulfurase family protein [unclassified Wolbachia]MDE5059879.1 cysteine desulfurase family protein [Wolbachia endosymbiont of Drosophila burlai]MDE5063623.1 cysteine desulfurase family protein [Wolbachia endosymbiont of Drosophila chauvacae]MDU8909566.1 cysteine desulfurase family protein [Wolbachia endosymbiont of Drosophila bocqueti]WOE62309.1 cysteine desulfurase family protein [Wolbachia endosymbiont of Drosophila aff. chauvacae BK-2020]
MSPFSLENSGCVYADYNATAPISENVKKSIFEVLLKQTLNPSSLHKRGQEARKILQDARDNVRGAIGVSSDKEIVFTSGATEANNLVMRGIAGYLHIISAIEHPSILNSACNPYIIPVNQEGIVDFLELEKILSELKGNKAIVSVMMANNETGVIQLIEEIAEIAHKFGAICHTDTAQSVGKIKVNMEDLGVDLLTLSAHKFGGVAGSGVLIFNKELAIEPIIIGGGQEKGFRGGTENIVAIAGLSAALQNIPDLLSKMDEVKELRDQLECELLNLASDIRIFGKNSKRLPNTSFIYMPGVKSDVQLMHFDLNHIAVSNGSACSSGKVEPSHVLLAMGATKEQAECSIRISIGPETKPQDIKKIVDCWYNIYKQNTLV